MTQVKGDGMSTMTGDQSEEGPVALEVEVVGGGGEGR